MRKAWILVAVIIIILICLLKLAHFNRVKGGEITTIKFLRTEDVSKTKAAIIISNIVIQQLMTSQ